VTIDTDPGGAGGATGIRVGATSYAPTAPEGGGTPALQVVALDRGTLALVRNLHDRCTVADSVCGKSIMEKLKGEEHELVALHVVERLGQRVDRARAN